VYNFSPGPCCLPDKVLKQAQAELLNWNGTGMSVMEISHRSPHFISIANKAESDLRAFMEIPNNFKIFFMNGGACL
jgi:phosphoserine aminotransferase